MSRIKIFIILSLALISAVHAQNQVQEQIRIAFKAGNAAELSRFFFDEIELVILEKEDLYSKKQAEQILKKFFTEHEPLAYKIIFEGGKEISRYAIGTLTTEDMVFRTYMLIKKEGGASLIHQLRIEEDEQDL